MENSCKLHCVHGNLSPSVRAGRDMHQCFAVVNRVRPEVFQHGLIENSAVKLPRNIPSKGLI